MKTKLVISAIALMLIATTAAFGQTWDHTKGIALGGGVFKFVGGNVDRAALGYSGALSLRYGLSSHLLFDLNVNYDTFKPTVEGERFKADKNDPYRTFLFPVVLDLKVTPASESSFKPYGFFGVGLLPWELRDVSAGDKSLLGDQEFIWGDMVYDKTQYNPVFDIGVGLETYIFPGLALDLQA